MSGESLIAVLCTGFLFFYLSIIYILMRNIVALSVDIFEEE